MKAYGIPREKDIECPDVVDIQHYGMKSSVGQLATKSGEYRSYTRSVVNKNSTRRHFKRIERMSAKHNIHKTLNEE